MSENGLISLLGASPLLSQYVPAHPDVSTSQIALVRLCCKEETARFFPCLVSVPHCKLLGRMKT